MFAAISSLFVDHPYGATIVSTLFVSSAVGAMPSPAVGSNGFYRWFFDFIHAFTGGIFRVLATRNPQFQSLSGAQMLRPENQGVTDPEEVKQIVDAKREITKQNGFDKDNK